MYLNTVHIYTYLCCLIVYFNLRLVLCLYTHICTYQQKQDIKKQNVCCLNLSPIPLTRILVFTNVKGICFTKHFCLILSQMYQFCLYPGAMTSLRSWVSVTILLSVKLLNWKFLTSSASEILDPNLPVEKSQSAVFEGQFS